MVIFLSNGRVPISNNTVIFVGVQYIYTSWYTQEFALMHVRSARYTSDIIQRVSKTTRGSFRRVFHFLTCASNLDLIIFHLPRDFSQTFQYLHMFFLYLPNIFLPSLLRNCSSLYIFRFFFAGWNAGKNFGDDDTETQFLKILNYFFETRFFYSHKILYMQNYCKK